ncbi:polyadenylate-binding protein-interacting protein 1 isoform X2 [Ovis canadensis]|uniref:polyadenylate-binding protein-interacting protein 1 isoform X2 n=1 Tax=Ovis canadensis TaxID=37174 RepID=UPI003752F023
MSDGFDRAPGAGRGRSRGLGRGGGGPEGAGFPNGAGPAERPRHQPPPPPQPKAPGFLQPPPLRQPRTAPPPGAQCEVPAGPQRPARPGALPEQTRPLRAPSSSPDNIPQQNSESAMAKPQVVVAPVLMSKLSVNAPEFYPSSYSSNYTESYEDGCEDYPTLSEYVQDFLNHLTEQPGSFETEIGQFAETLNGWVTTDDALQELVELIYQQATSIPNFSYMGARLCNYLSHHLTISPQSGNFRQLLLQRCRTEYEVKDQAAKGDEVTRKRFHAFVLFLGELYLNLEIKGTNGQVTRADILQVGLRELLNALFSNPMDDNLICAVKLLKLTGSVLEDAWKEKGKTDMEEIIQRIENVVLDANCSRNMKPSKPVQFLGHEETVCKAMEAVCPGQGREGRTSSRLLPRTPSLPLPFLCTSPLHMSQRPHPCKWQLRMETGGSPFCINYFVSCTHSLHTL